MVVSGVSNMVLLSPRDLCYRRCSTVPSMYVWGEGKGAGGMGYQSQLPGSPVTELLPLNRADSVTYSSGNSSRRPLPLPLPFSYIPSLWSMMVSIPSPPHPALPVPRLSISLLCLWLYHKIRCLLLHASSLSLFKMVTSYIWL